MLIYVNIMMWFPIGPSEVQVKVAEAATVFEEIQSGIPQNEGTRWFFILKNY